MHHEIRAVDEYASWGFDNFGSSGNTDLFGDLNSNVDSTDSSFGDLGYNFDDSNLYGDSNFNLDDPSTYQLAQIPGDVPLPQSVDNTLDYQSLDMNTVPLVQDLQPAAYEETYEPNKALKPGKNGASYLNIDGFNDGIAPGMTVAGDRNLEDAWKHQASYEPTLWDGWGGGPGIAAGEVNLGWNTHFEGPQMIYDFNH